MSRLRWRTVALVILVVFVFLQNFRATFIPLVTVPVSLIGALVAFPILGFSINTLTLLGLVLAIGTVVDDAIVVVEAVMAKIETGMSPREARRTALLGVKLYGRDVAFLYAANKLFPIVRRRQHPLLVPLFVDRPVGMNEIEFLLTILRE